MEDIAVEGGDGRFAAGIIGGDIVGRQRAFGRGIVTLGVSRELLLPAGATGRVRHLGTDTLRRGTEKRGVRLLLLIVRGGVRVLDDIGVRAPVAGAEDDFVVGRGATAEGCQRVAQEYLSHCFKVFRKYSYLLLMFCLCSGYPIRRSRERQGKGTTKFRDMQDHPRPLKRRGESGR